MGIYIFFCLEISLSLLDKENKLKKANELHETSEANLKHLQKENEELNHRSAKLLEVKK